MYADAHIHLRDLARREGSFDSLGSCVSLPENGLMCVNSCVPDEFAEQESYVRPCRDRTILSFGVHPQNPDPALFPFLEKVAREGMIGAIGECGFDLFDESMRSRFDSQKEVWALQLNLARELSLPLVIHNRKAMHLFFGEARRLARLPAVIFHGWNGSAREAESFLSKGVNAFFSIGKGLLRGQKTIIESASCLPLERILSETDAPWMALKGEPFSRSCDIKAVADAIISLRREGAGTIIQALEKNFRAAYFLPG